MLMTWHARCDVCVLEMFLRIGREQKKIRTTISQERRPMKSCQRNAAKYGMDKTRKRERQVDYSCAWLTIYAWLSTTREMWDVLWLTRWIDFMSCKKMLVCVWLALDLWILLFSQAQAKYFTSRLTEFPFVQSFTK